MRIASLLPSATEILWSLGLVDDIVGVSHECDFPAAVREKPAVIHSRLPHGASAAEIDRIVREFMARGESLYGVDADLLHELKPDLIVTQDLCHVCSASPEDLASALTKCDKRPEVLCLNPQNLSEVWRDVMLVAQATSRVTEGQEVLRDIRERLDTLARQIAVVTERPRVAFLEWLDPFYVGGHWVPEMVALAGGEDVFGEIGRASFRVTMEQVVAAAPEIIIVSPCGYDAKQAAQEYRKISWPAEWFEIPAVKNNRVYAFEANSYASRPGPRLATGVEALAKILHPKITVSKDAERGFFLLNGRREDQEIGSPAAIDEAAERRAHIL
jgi:iron complex transport system substrate-binding protein